MAALQVAELSFEAIAALRPLMMRIKRSDRALADQLTRAATSVALNIAEADGLEAGNRRARFFTALGSAKESLAALRAAECWRYITPEEALAASSLLRRIIAMLWKLTHWVRGGRTRGLKILVSAGSIPSRDTNFGVIAGPSACWWFR